MSRLKTFQDLFKRYRRPGDMVFALAFFLFALFLLVNLPMQTTWVEKRTQLFAQPAFWPAISLVAMTFFAGLHLLGAVVSERIPGRLAEVLYWLRSLEYAAWFMAYVLLVPVIGYLLATILFCGTLSFRLGYRSPQWLLASTVFAVAVVVLFKSFLQVKIPAGAIYDALPPGAFRSFMMTYL
ncbi:tripartite tricarboxylate transporter TctB family protein [Pseudoruegeria sp. HB172150]|uniref:tripartite tricarboxylate transporter TctB family protein n=1 Tax=Pseudoruegeria sp. HB172150 TaxID=2721164 RepID=UPI0015523424|nr:tripartite tricarboxylate transporter TctB family protein [Pseudoruegeria sp. HB172150]